MNNEWVRTPFDKHMVAVAQARSATVRVRMDDGHDVPATLIGWYSARRARVKFASGSCYTVKQADLRLPADLERMRGA